MESNKRRKIGSFSKDEDDLIKTRYKTLGPQWKQILTMGGFQEGRIGPDIKDRARNMGVINYSDTDNNENTVATCSTCHQPIKIGIIYVFGNKFYNDSSGIPIYKIGQTQNLDDRLQHLNKTATPFPFTVLYAVEINNYMAVEKRIHNYLNKYRINPSREFFKIPVDDLKSVFKLLGGNVMKDWI